MTTRPAPHKLRARTLYRLCVVGAVALASAVLGALPSDPAQELPQILAWALIGALSGAALATLEILLQGPGAAAMRRLPVLAVLLLRCVLYGALFLAAHAIARVILHALLPPDAVPDTPLTTIGILEGVAIAFAINSVFVLRALLGPGTLWALLTGRYHRPRSERRIVLFIDLQGSTALALRIGDAAFMRFLNRVFARATDPVLESGGAIYRYVGDEIIITWPFARGIRDAACVACLFAIKDALAASAAEDTRLFGTAPRIRAALHAGSLVVGEMGEIKREIVLLGDTMNTAARIEEACRTTGADTIIAGPLLQALPGLPDRVQARSLGEFALRGRDTGLELFALSREAASNSRPEAPAPQASPAGPSG